MTPPLCSRPRCDTPAISRTMCEAHYRTRVRAGIYGYRDATRVLDHIRKLRDLGWTWHQMGEASGVAFSVPHALWRGRYRRIQADKEQALLAIPLVPVASHRGVDSCGTRRRVQALAWMGWPASVVADRTGIPVKSLQTLILPHRRISMDYALRVAGVYAELSHLTGPSRIAAGKARGLGFAPPAAWDDDTIDDPASVPDVGGSPTRGVDPDEVLHLAKGGCSDWEIARKVGATEKYVQQLRREVA